MFHNLFQQFVCFEVPQVPFEVFGKSLPDVVCKVRQGLELFVNVLGKIIVQVGELFLFERGERDPQFFWSARPALHRENRRGRFC